VGGGGRICTNIGKETEGTKYVYCRIHGRRWESDVLSGQEIQLQGCDVDMSTI
jgi:hypothetical protein